MRNPIEETSRPVIGTRVYLRTESEYAWHRGSIATVVEHSKDFDDVFYIKFEDRDGTFWCVPRYVFIVGKDYNVNLSHEFVRNLILEKLRPSDAARLDSDGKGGYNMSFKIGDKNQ